MRTGIIYLVSNTVTEHLYVGQTIRPIEVRWNRHKKDASLGSDVPLHRAIRKHGVENFNVEEICQVPVEWLDAVEIGFIKLLGSFGKGYNATPGGDGFGSGEDHPFFGKPRPEHVRLKIAASHIGIRPSEETLAKLRGRKRSEQACLNIRLAMLGKNKGEENHFFGKKHSDEFKERQRARVLGTRLSEEHKAKIAAGNKGKRMSEESKVKMKIAAFKREAAKKIKREMELHEKAS